MERDQVNVFVWPVCRAHQLGTHADVVDSLAVWWCNGGVGHVLAKIGELARAHERRQRRDRRSLRHRASCTAQRAHDYGVFAPKAPSSSHK